MSGKMLRNLKQLFCNKKFWNYGQNNNVFWTRDDAPLHINIEYQTELPFYAHCLVAANMIHVSPRKESLMEVCSSSKHSIQSSWIYDTPHCFRFYRKLILFSGMEPTGHRYLGTNLTLTCTIFCRIAPALCLCLPLNGSRSFLLLFAVLKDPVAG